MLAHELCNMLDEKMLLIVTDVPNSDGAMMLRRLQYAIMKSTTDRTAALHERFAHPSATKKKEKLSTDLRQWREDLEELQASGAPPSKPTVLPSLKQLIGALRELKMPLAVIDLVKPGDPKAMYAVAVKKANEWAIFDNDSRITTANPSAYKIVCKFWKVGRCTKEGQCSFEHQVLKERRKVGAKMREKATAAERRTARRP